ncbi:MAG: YfcE family phosphodiesterase [Erysipelotrichaceae bacterium]
MKIVVISDNHGLEKIVHDIKLLHSDADYFIHCGDSEMDKNLLSGYTAVLGNNDYNGLRAEEVLEMGMHRAYITHGHRHMFTNQIQLFLDKAESYDCDFVFYGHSHVFSYQIIDGVHLINPGSLNYNRDRSNPCYCVVETNEDVINVQRIDIS